MVSLLFLPILVPHPRPCHFASSTPAPLTWLTSTLAAASPQVDNPEHTDVPDLQDMLLRSHMHDLRVATQEIHYENYRRCARGACPARLALEATHGEELWARRPSTDLASGGVQEVLRGILIQAESPRVNEILTLIVFNRDPCFGPGHGVGCKIAAFLTRAALPDAALAT